MSDAIVRMRRNISAVLDPLTLAWKRATSRTEIRAALLVLLLLAVLLYPLWEKDQSRLSVATSTEVYILLALGLNVVIGFAGLLDLGYAAFFAIGAYTIAILGSSFVSSSHHISLPLLNIGRDGVHVNFFLLIPIAAMTAAFCGLLFGAPTLRLRGDYLAIVTLGFGEIVPLVIRNLGPDNSLGWPNITNGVNRIVGLESPPDGNFGPVAWSFSGNTQRPWYYLGLIIVIFSVIVIYSLRSSRLGRAWAAIREDEIAAAHMGINITRTRLLAFALGAAFSGFGGLLIASQIGSVESTQFDFSVSITILVMVIFGGMGSIPGAIIGAFIIEYLSLLWLEDISNALNGLGASLQSAPGPVGSFGDWLHRLDLSTAKQLIFGVILLVMMLLRPQGIWPSSTRTLELQPETAGILDEENADLYTTRTE